MTLPVIQEDTRTRQDCARCPQARKCWDTSRDPSDNALVLNLLVCRLKTGIKTNATTRAILKLLRPKLLKLVEWVHKATGTSRDELMCDAQSTLIEMLLTDYQMGERAWPIHYLFARPKGVMSGWAMRYIRKEQTYSYRHVSTQDDEDDMPPAPEPEPLLTPVETPSAVEDGVTLTTAEYRVLRFCLQNADTLHARTAVNGLHKHIGEAMGVRRTVASKHFRSASLKLLEVTGRTQSALQTKGVVAADVNTQRRRRWILGIGDAANDRLNTDEIRGLLREGVAGIATLADVCWGYGVSDRTYYYLLKRQGQDGRDTRSANQPGAR